MIKLHEYTNQSHTPLAFELSTPYGEDGDKHNLLHIAVWRFGWYFIIPQLIKPKSVWVAAMDPSPEFKGYYNHIRKSYGFCVFEEAIHVHYGIQPGSWSRDDPANSDHTKVFNFPWMYKHVRHDVYYTDGSRASCGEYFREWTNRKVDNKPFNKETRNVDFQTVPWFTLPMNDTPEFVRKNRDVVFSEVQTDGEVFRFYEYKDPYDGEVTVARVNIEEREWIRGRWKWLRSVLKHVPGCRIIRRSMDIEFRNEVGSRKGSWKGGTIGMGFTMHKDETLDECWNRFIVSNERPGCGTRR